MTNKMSKQKFTNPRIDKTILSPASLAAERLGAAIAAKTRFASAQKASSGTNARTCRRNCSTSMTFSSPRRFLHRGGETETRGTLRKTQSRPTVLSWGELAIKPQTPRSCCNFRMQGKCPAQQLLATAPGLKSVLRGNVRLSPPRHRHSDPGS